MPIKIQRDLPARAILESENIFVMDEDRAMSQDIRPLEILILNLIFTFSIDLKWFYLLLFEVATFFLGIPKRLLGKFLRVSWKVVPVAFVLMLLNVLLRGRVKTFQATPHHDTM